jgi:rhodanese-related sulfurtransferase
MSDLIECEQFTSAVKDGSVDIIDVRTAFEFSEMHVRGAVNVPLDGLNPRSVMAHRNGNADSPLYIICRSGSRGARACKAFIDAGYSNVINVEGGTMAWEKAGLPVVKGAKTVISLERQFRIAAGSLTLLGSVLALTIHPWFAVLPAFVGAGLLFAGITEMCGMGLMLARMPWNRTAARAMDGQDTCGR